MKKTKKIYFILSYALAFAVLYFLADILLKNLSDIRNYSFDYGRGDFFAPAAFGVLNVISLFLIWFYILKKINGDFKLGARSGFEVFINAWLGRYIPGKIWPFAGKVYFGVMRGGKRGDLTLASFFELSLSTVAHFFLFLLSVTIIVFTPSGVLAVLSALLVILFFILIHPKVLIPVLNFFLEKLKKTKINVDSTLSYGNIIFISLLYIIPILFGALSFLFVSQIFIDSFTGLFLPIICTFIAASFISKISFFPAGIGIREGALALFLTPYMPVGAATAAVLVSRTILIFVDILLWFSVFIFSWLRKNNDY